MIPILALLLSAPAISFATVDSPVVQGLGGAGRAGVAGEALFLNPASVALLNQSASFLYYIKPSVPEWNAGGRGFAAGVYDGQNPAAKGSFGYLRTSRARIALDGSQDYEDRTEYRFAVGRALWSDVAGGLAVRYVTRRAGATETKFFDGDLGAIFPVYTGIMGGLTYENASNKEGEQPPKLGGGLSYALGYGVQLYADGYRFMKGTAKGQRGWALGAEMSLAASFRARAGKFQDGFRRLKGWSAGVTWAGPRTSFDYAMRVTGDGPKERDHMFGMTVVF